MRRSVRLARAVREQRRYPGLTAHHFGLAPGLIASSVRCSGHGGTRDALGLVITLAITEVGAETLHDLGDAFSAGFSLLEEIDQPLPGSVVGFGGHGLEDMPDRRLHFGAGDVEDTLQPQPRQLGLADCLDRPENCILQRLDESVDLAL